MSLPLLIALGECLFFLVGVLTGTGITTKAQHDRSKRLAEAQHQLAIEWQVLRQVRASLEQGKDS